MILRGFVAVSIGWGWIIRFLMRTGRACYRWRILRWRSWTRWSIRSISGSGLRRLIERAGAVPIGGAFDGWCFRWVVLLMGFWFGGGQLPVGQWRVPGRMAVRLGV